jgi:NADH dehydrogenase
LTDVVTGAFSYTGRHIAEALLARGRSVRTLTRRPAPARHPLADRIEAAPLRFDGSLVDSLRGADTLYNTYWVRFERGSVSFDLAVANSLALFRAARAAGVRRIVHLSVSNPSLESPLPYFRGKAEVEHLLHETGVSHAIVRPTLVFGPEDLLVNNIAWILRRFPVFLVPGDGRYEVQPVSVRDTARIAVDAGEREDDVVLDAAGPERWTFQELVRLIARAVGSRARIMRGSPRVALTLTRAAGVPLRDVVLTREELAGLMDGLLLSHEPPLGVERFDAWLDRHASELGRRYVSELARNFRG